MRSLSFRSKPEFFSETSAGPASVITLIWDLIRVYFQPMKGTKTNQTNIRNPRLFVN